jgi:ABC-type Zn uptake system ZnuABC Zn-binding protein ZnuA
LRGARNAKVQPGAPGHLDASQAIQAIEIPTATVDRSQGDVHPLGNPHYMSDPVNGLKVARLIRDRLAAIRPEKKELFEQRLEDFRKRLGIALIGEKLAGMYDVEKLMQLEDRGGLDDFLKKQNQSELLGGWLGKMRPYRGTPVVDDHPLWSYFARRFGLEIVGHMEPKPGLNPTTRHLKVLVTLIRQKDVKAVLSSPFFDEAHAAFLTQNTGARSVVLAHQVQALPEADQYISMFDHNIDELIEALQVGGVK